MPRTKNRRTAITSAVRTMRDALAATKCAVEAWRSADEGRDDIANGMRTQALERHVTKKWLGRAETLAKVDHLKHGGWHMFRRGWATARKHFPLKDVAEAGGWGDTASVVKCYQHADQETTRKVVLTVA